MGIRNILGAAAIVLAGTLVSMPVSAVTCPADSVRGKSGAAASTLAECNVPVDDSLMPTITNIINVIVGVLGVVAVIVVILGGVQYVTSAGDPGKVKKAKDTIMYGIIGLVVALLAFAIVNFVLSSITQAPDSSNPNATTTTTTTTP